MRSRPPDLDRLERWMQEVITHPGGVHSAIASPEAQQLLPIAVQHLGEVVDRSRALSSGDRLQIYANMYFWRLHDVLCDEFPTVRHLVGADRFTALARSYVTRHPPAHWSLAMLGARFAAFLEEAEGELPERGLAAELARLERAMEEVFSERAAAPVAERELREVPGERWPQARFRTIPALRLMACDYPANEYLQAVRDGRPMDPPQRRESWVAVYRRDLVVWRSPLCRDRYLLLSAVAAGATLESALAECAARGESNAAQLAASLADWFREWTAEGLFAAVDWEPREQGSERP